MIKANLNRFLFISISILVIAFSQNCSKTSFESNQNEKIDEFPDDSNSLPDQIESSSFSPGAQPSSPTDQSGVEPDQPSQNISPLECQRDYVSVFEWENPDVNPSEEAAPLWGQNKLGTIKVFSTPGVPASVTPITYFGNTHWRFYLNLTTDSSNNNLLTLYTNKLDQMDTSKELTCYMGPYMLNGTVTNPLARTTFQNVGVGLNSVDGLVGYLSMAQKFVACKITKGSDDVGFHSADGSRFSNAGKAFILKRGCFQN